MKKKGFKKYSHGIRLGNQLQSLIRMKDEGDYCLTQVHLDNQWETVEMHDNRCLKSNFGRENHRDLQTKCIGLTFTYQQQVF